MKKIAIASLLALAAISASAVEVGITGTRDYSGTDRNFGGITLSEKFGNYGVALGLERSSISSNDQTRLSVVGDREVVKLGPVSVAGRLGVAYLNNQTSADGYALTVGVGASAPVSKKVSVGLAVDRQYGQDRIESFDGNRLTVSAKYSF